MPRPLGSPNHRPYLYAYELAPILSAIRERGMTYSEVARAAGFRRTGARANRADGSRVRRYLGLAPMTWPQPPIPAFNRVTEDYALKLAEAVGIDPMDINL